MSAGVRVKIAGDDLGEFLPGRLDLKAAFTLKAGTGLSPRALLEGVQDMDPGAFQALAWFLAAFKYDETTQRYAPTGNVPELSGINFCYDDIEIESVKGDDPKEETLPTDESSTSGS